MRLRYQRCLFSLTASALLVVGCSGSDGEDGTDGANGQDGAGSALALIKTTALEVGDANCPAGGTQIDTGLDNGDGGGTAGDATLQPGEVDASERICNGSSDTRVNSFAPPEGAAGTSSINAKGGNATAAGSSGGQGGYIDFQFDYGSNGGHLKMFKTGLVDASFAVPAVPATSYFGAVPLVVASGTTHVKRVTNLTDAVDVDGGALAAGDIVQPYSSGCDWYALYRWNSTSSADVITGVHVQTGATLTFDHATAACSNHYVIVDFVVRNEGVISTGRAPEGGADTLYLQVGSYLGTTGSSIALTGADGAAVDGGAGGQLYISAQRLADNVGSLWNFGTINTSGGSGNNGGSGGDVYFWAGGGTINTGTITARGGAATIAAGTAGPGGGVELEAGYGELDNSAVIDTSGGSGGTIAGDAGYIYLYTTSSGDFRNTGELRAIGGTPTAGCAAACSGGSGGSVYLGAYGDLLNSAPISSYGGDGLTGVGGAGDYIDFYTDTGSSLVANGDNSSHGGIWVSGTLDSHGGDGAAGGGAGGEVYAEAYLYYTPFGQEIAFYGYGGGIDISGGAGDAQGGDAGYVYLYQTYGYLDSGDYTSGGSIINYADITVKGGNAANGAGGNGAYVEGTTYDYNYGGGAFEKIINYGAIDTSGGNGTTTGGIAGYVKFYGLDGVENQGAITARGGNATAAAGIGGYCDSNSFNAEGNHGITLVSDNGDVVNTGTLTNVGGNGTGAASTGGSSAGIIVFGNTTDNSGSLVADGGDADAAGTGGNGGVITIRATTGRSVNTAASMTASGGTGAAGSEGTDGLISVDGQLL